MKNIKILFLATICTLLGACMGADYAEPEMAENPYGNNSITVSDESQILTIAELKAKFASVISSSGLKEIEDDIFIKGVITGNDIQGNIYNEVAMQDETGALLVCISQGGLYGPLPVGQKLLISLKGLMIGGYGMQPEIGGVYTNANTGAKSIGRMSRYVWNEHYKIIEDNTQISIEPELFDQTQMTKSDYLAENCGKLMTIEGVTLKDANGTNVFAPDDGSVTLTANCCNRAFSGISSSSLVLRTSTYADFANQAMPEGLLNVTGIFTRYRNTWQILIRTIDDIQPGTVWTVDELEGSGHGTEDDPFDVTRAIALTNSGHNDTSVEVVVKGIISSISEISTQFGNATYFISNDGKPENSLQVYRGYYLNGEKFQTGDELKEGQEVTILGKLKLYKDEPEIDTGSKILSIK